VPAPPPFLSIVVIGLNEERNLERCLRSALGGHWPPEAREVLYVDSGSTDRSLQIARSLQGVEVLELQDPRPNAAKGRNLGWRAARGELVQFLDGDMELDAGWLALAAATLPAPPQAAQAQGAVVEGDRHNLFHRIFELDWTPRTGPVRSSGGAALYRRALLCALGGFDEALPEGEEPDLCWRIRNLLGLEVWKLAAPMCLHDLGMRTVGQWWRRTARTGRAYATLGLRYWGSRDPLYRKELLNILALGALFLLAPLLALALRSWWPMAVLLGLLAALVARKTWQCRGRAGSWSLALAYALHIYLGRLPLFRGALGRLGSTAWSFFRTGKGRRAA